MSIRVSLPSSTSMSIRKFTFSNHVSRKKLIRRSFQEIHILLHNGHNNTTFFDYCSANVIISVTVLKKMFKNRFLRTYAIILLQKGLRSAPKCLRMVL